MTEHTKRTGKRKLPCNWVDEEEFTVTPAVGPETEPQDPTDTAFLLKAKQTQHPPRLQSP